MPKHLLILALCCLVCATATTQQVFVLPAVTDNNPGINDSLWVTVVHIIKKNPHDVVTVKRKWVCVPEGGFLLDPTEAYTWTMDPNNTGRGLGLSGRQLLSGSDSDVGAVALEIDGGEVIVNSRVVDISRGTAHLLMAFGQGQFIAPFQEPLEGSSHIPWVGGCLNSPCGEADPHEWNYYRNNIGLINPNPEAVNFDAVVIPFGPENDGNPGELYDEDPETFLKSVPAFGWKQFSWEATHTYGGTLWGDQNIPYAGFIISLTPDKELPYFAYASVVFSPDPDTGIPAFNDPMFVPAEPGFIAPWAHAP